MDGGSQKLGLSDLLDQDLSSYEFFYSLPARIQEEVRKEDPGSFFDLQEIVSRCR